LPDERARLRAHGGLLEQAGYEATTSDADADVIVINTCSVREHAEEKLYTRLGELRVLRDETGRAPVVAVAGCVAQQEGESLLKKSNGRLIDVIMGTQRLKMLPLLVERAQASAFPTIDTDSGTTSRSRSASRIERIP
jgi:tRNA-2-methylthio-N6-dimethylallyladenosine synthase